MIYKIMMMVAAAASAMALNSCGGIPAEPLDANSTTTVLNEVFANGGILESLPRGNGTPTLPLAGISPSSTALETLVAGCETVTTSGDTPDGDGFDTLKVYTFDCTDLLDGTVQYTRKGTAKFIDLDPTVDGIEGGFRAEYDVPVYDSKDLTSGSEYSYQYLGFFEYKKVGSSFVSTSEYTGKNLYVTQHGENNYTFTSTWDWKMTPTDPNSAWDAGTLEINGSFKLNGKFINEINGVHTQGQGDFFVNYRTEGLNFDQANCTKYYKSGSFFIEDGNGTIIEIRYACDSAELFINGKLSDLWQVQ